MVFTSADKTWSELWRGAFDYYSISRYGAYFYFDSEWQDGPAVSRLHMSDRKLEKVVSLRDFPRVRGAYGTWFDLAPDDSPLLLRNLSTEQLFELDVQLP